MLRHELTYGSFKHHEFAHFFTRRAARSFFAYAYAAIGIPRLPGVR
jgi:hypothetical protein